jgi:hypothetical protein
LAATSVSAAITTEVEIAVAAADNHNCDGGDTSRKGPFALKATVIEASHPGGGVSAAV